MGSQAGTPPQGVPGYFLKASLVVERGEITKRGSRTAGSGWRREVPGRSYDGSRPSDSSGGPPSFSSSSLNLSINSAWNSPMSNASWYLPER